jgi:hypothetical protein
VEAFEQLLPAFEQAYREWWEEQDRKREKKRQRQPGGGRPATLYRGADRLLFILFYFRQYPIQEVQGYLFGISQGQANVWIHRLTPVLNAALGYEMQLPARKAARAGEVLAACPGLEFIIDATERPIARPKDKEKQRECYSGKKKRHTRKNTIITEKGTGKIKVLGPTEPGRKNDKKMADEEDWPYPPGSTLWKDKGYQGYEPDGVETRQPKKKPRGKELRLIWNWRGSPICGGILREAVIAFNIKIKALKNMGSLTDTITSPHEGFDFSVQAFNKATAQSSHKVVGDILKPIRSLVSGNRKCSKNKLEQIEP